VIKIINNAAFVKFRLVRNCFRVELRQRLDLTKQKASLTGFTSLCLQLEIRKRVHPAFPVSYNFYCFIFLDIITNFKYFQGGALEFRKKRAVLLAAKKAEEGDESEEDEETMDVEKKKTERDIEVEMGDDYILDLQKRYDLPEEEKYDVIPEFWEGHNIADYIDPDIFKVFALQNVL